MSLILKLVSIYWTEKDLVVVMLHIFVDCYVVHNMVNIECNVWNVQFMHYLGFCSSTIWWSKVDRETTQHVMSVYISFNIYCTYVMEILYDYRKYCCWYLYCCFSRLHQFIGKRAMHVMDTYNTYIGHYHTKECIFF